jgi:hypothetical protein
MITKRFRVLFILVTLLTACQKNDNNEIFIKDGNAVQGYDVVAYFKDGMPTPGLTRYAYKWNDATWLFSSEENRNAFTNDPAMYAPKYGGYCAYGMSEGHKAPTDPDAWTIVDGKLYLNYNTDVKSEWVKDQTVHIGKADKNWPVVKQERL